MIYPAGYDDRQQGHAVGSFGIPVIKPGETNPMMLTAAHVVGSLSPARDQDPTEVLLVENAWVLPSDPRIGMVHVSHPPAPDSRVEIDASLVTTETHDTLLQVVRGEETSRHPRDINSIEDVEDLVVYKRGINPPNLTAGILDLTPETVKIKMPGINEVLEYVRVYPVTGTDLDTPFARAGDSGAVVIDEDDCVLGLIVGLQSDTPHDPHPQDPAFIVAITDVLDALGVELIGPDRHCMLS